MRGKGCFLFAVFGLLLFLPVTTSFAVPSLTRQTGYACTDCHTVFPELTPLGRNFVLRGYASQARADLPQYFIPVCAIANVSYTVADTTPAGTSLTSGVAPFDSTDHNASDRTNIPQQVFFYYGGKIYGNLGALIQVTYDGTANAIALDNSDIRYADSTKLAGKELVYGVSINNNPTTQCVWNTFPIWSFPYYSSAVALTPAASPLFDGLGAQVGGIAVYGYWNDLIYVEGAVYRTTRNGITMPLGLGSTPPATLVKGAAPHWHVGVQHEWGDQSIYLGTLGIVADVFPSGFGTGPTDTFTDTGLNAEYQYIGKNHLVSAEASFIYEDQDRSASFADGLAANPTDRLNALKANATYTYRSGTRLGDLSGTLGYFYTWGNSDPLLYAPARFTGSGNGKPDSSGFILEADYLPWQTVKFAAQYTIYTKFNGNGDDYDGFGTDASHNNTLYLYAQFAF